MPKHFKRGVKREHHLLKGIEKALEEISGLKGVKKSYSREDLFE